MNFSDQIVRHIEEIEGKMLNRVTQIKNELDEFEAKLKHGVKFFKRIIQRDNNYFEKTNNKFEFRIKGSSKHSRIKIQHFGALLCITDILEFTCLPYGGQFESNISDMKVQIENGSIDSNAKFQIRQIETKNINYPFNVTPISPVFEFKPHSVPFNKPIKIFYKRRKFYTPLNDNICLFKQDINHFYNGKNIWSISFPKENDSFMLEFELNSFSIIFFAYCEYCKYGKFTKKYEPYQIIEPGLNYRICCSNETCADKLIIRPMGFSSFQTRDFLPNSDSIICSKCKEGIVIKTSEFYKIIKTIILFECIGSIQLNESKVLVKADEGKLYLINFNEEDSNALICINTKKNDSGKRLIAGLNAEQFNVKEKANNKNDEFFGDQESQILGDCASMFVFIIHPVVFVLIINSTFFYSYIW